MVPTAHGGADGTAEGVDGAGNEPRVGLTRIAFWAGAQVHPNKTAAPASPRQPTRDYGRARRAVNLWGLQVEPGSFSRPFTPRRGCRLPVGVLPYGVS